MRSMLVEPGVRSGTPAVMMMRSPGLPKPSSMGDAAGAVDHVVEVGGVGRTTQCVPHSSDSRRAVSRTGDSAMIGTCGRSRAARRPVVPDAV